jgi:two-component system CheB/CheR fusion protein
LAERPAAAELPASDPLSDIAVVDDDPGVREALRTLLEGRGYRAATFASGEAFLSEAGRGRFRCVLVDIALAGMSGIELQRRLRQEPHPPPIILLTGSADVGMAVAAMREGAADFLQKPIDSATLLESVAKATEPAAEAMVDQALRTDVAARLARLTRREREVMDRITAGQLNKNIAADLGISERTTEHHRQSVMRKMGAKSLAMLVRMMTRAEGG